MTVQRRGHPQLLTFSRLLIAAALLWLINAASVTAEPAPTEEPGEEMPPSPIEIEADEGIEWRREANVVIARGNVEAHRGDLDVRAQELRAYYREAADGSTEITRLEADDQVVIAYPGETAYAQHGVYDMEQKVLTLTGGTPNRIVAGSSEITADDKIKYWTEQRKLLAIGNAVAVEPDRRLYAEEITAFLREEGSGGSGGGGDDRLERLEGRRNVRVVTRQEVVRAERGDYDADRGIANVSGNVKITRGDTQLNGCRGIVDFNTGISRLLACDGGRERVRVKGLVVPESNETP